MRQHGAGIQCSIGGRGLARRCWAARLGPVNHWLIKSEPDVFSIDDLERVGREPWNGVRNYQARNFMRDGMELGDLALFYHSNAKPPGVAGIARVASGA